MSTVEMAAPRKIERARSVWALRWLRLRKHHAGIASLFVLALWELAGKAFSIKDYLLPVPTKILAAATAHADGLPYAGSGTDMGLDLTNGYGIRSHSAASVLDLI